MFYFGVTFWGFIHLQFLSFPGVSEADTSLEHCMWRWGSALDAREMGGTSCGLCASDYHCAKSKAGFSAQDFYPRLEVGLILVAYIIKNFLCFTVFIGRLHFLNCSFTVVYKENTPWRVFVFMICISRISWRRVSFKVSCLAVVISLWNSHFEW